MTRLRQYYNPQTGEESQPQIDRKSRKRRAPPSARDQNASKKSRVKGGRPAYNKEIVADYDTDDGRIITLKQQGYTDDYVAQKMISEGRMKYVPKTVGSRWLRLRKVLEAAENERLDDELSDWHVGEVRSSDSKSLWNILLT